jgi:hypothetical protein
MVWTVMMAGLWFSFAFGASAQNNPPPATYVRTFANDVLNQPLVTVTVTGAVNVASFTIEETLPGPATATSVSGDGVYLPAKNVIRWGPFFNTVATNVSYRLTGLPGSYPVNGGAWMDGQWFFSPGITMITVQPLTSSGGVPSPPPQVATPVFTPPGGGSVPVSVTITDATPAAVIYYTLDGSLPTQSSTLYTGPVPLATAGVLRAAAFTNGWTPSVAVAAFYGQPAVAVNAQVTRNVSGNSTTAPVVTFNVTPGNNANCVAMTESLPPGVGAINISSGGNYIASNNVVLWGPFLGTNVQTLSYQAVGLPGVYPVRASWSVDGVSGTEPTGTNLVIAASGVNGTIPTPPPQVAAPVFTPASGASVPVSVTITDATPAVVIYYTLDGSLPTQSSTLYTGPVPLASASVLRAAAFTNGWTPSVAVAAFYGQPAVVVNAQVTRNVSGNSTAAPVVTFSVTPGAGAQCVAVTETLPAGIGATSISSGGNYIASNNVVLWGPFLGTNVQTLSYQAVGLPGVYPVRASWSVDGVSGAETTGTNLVVAASGVNGTLPFPPPQVATPVLLPATASSLPVSVTITDATPAAVIYYTLDGSLPTPSSTLYTGPVPLASASVLRAAAFTNGWTPSVATVGVYIPPPTTDTVSVTHSIFGNATAVPVVNFTATPQGPVSCYAVVEMIPLGLTPSGLSGDGIWDPITGAIRWGPYFDNQPRGFYYSVSGLSGTYQLSGLVSFDGYSLSTGTTIVQINTSVTSLTTVTLLISNIVRNTDGSVTLNFVGQPDATTRIWATTNLALPLSWQPIFTNTTTSLNGTWQFIDINTAGYPIRFYRFSMP